MQLREDEGQVEEEVAPEGDVRSRSEENCRRAELDQGARFNPLQCQGGARDHETGGLPGVVPSRPESREDRRDLQGEDEGDTPCCSTSAGRGGLANLSCG